MFNSTAKQPANRWSNRCYPPKLPYQLSKRASGKARWDKAPRFMKRSSKPRKDRVHEALRQKFKSFIINRLGFEQYNILEGGGRPADFGKTREKLKCSDLQVWVHFRTRLGFELIFLGSLLNAPTRDLHDWPFKDFFFHYLGGDDLTNDQSLLLKCEQRKNHFLAPVLWTRRRS